MKIKLLFFLCFFYAVQLVGQNKKVPLSPFTPNLNTTGVIGCSIFNDPTNYTCGSNFTYVAGVNNYQYTLNPGANSGCLTTTPNQIWFIVTVTSLTSNTLTFTQTNSSNVDVDAAIWGVLLNNDVNNACSSTLNTPLSCDYRVNAESVITINNPIVGQKYVMVVTNFSNSNTNISITQPTGGTVEYCKSNDVYNCQGSVPTASLTGNQTLCNTNTANLTVNFTGNAPWTYTINNGVGTATTYTNPLTIPVSPNVTTTYGITTVSNNCGIGTYSNNATVTVNKPTATLGGNQTICNGGSGNLMLSFTGTAPWTYTINNGVGTATTSTNPLTIPVSPTVTTTYNLTALSNSCGAGSFTNNAKVEIGQVATAALSGNQAICSGNSANLTLNFTGSAPWTYTINNGIGTATTSTNPLVIPVSPTTTTTYNVTFLSNSCGTGTFTNNATVVVNTLPSVNLTGSQIICEGSSANLKLSFTGSGPWSYTIDNGIGSGSTSTNPLFIPVSPTTTTTYRVTALSNSCGTGYINGNAFVQVSYYPTATLTGTQAICPGTQANLTINTTGTFPITYTIDNGVGTLIHNLNPRIISVSPTTTTEYKITSISNSCGTGSITNDAVVSVGVTPVASLTGTQTICAGESTNLVLSFVGTPPFSYTIPGIGSETTSENLLIIPVSPNATTGYNVNAYSDACSSGTFNGGAVITVNQPTTATLTSNNAICVGYLGELTLNFSGTAPWTYTIDNGVGTATTSINPRKVYVEPTVTTTYHLTGLSNTCGVGTYINNAPITVNQKPTATLSAIDTTVCIGNTVPIRADFTGQAPWTYRVMNNNYLTTTSPVYIPVNAISYTQNIVLDFVNDNRCGSGTVSGNAIVRSYPRSTSTLTGGGSINWPDDSVNVTANFTGKGPWSFSFLNNSFTAATSTFDFKISPTYSGTYNISGFTDGCGDYAVAYNPVSVSICKRPIVGIVGHGNSIGTDYNNQPIIPISVRGDSYNNIVWSSGGPTGSFTSDRNSITVGPQTQEYTMLSVSNHCGTGIVSDGSWKVRNINDIDRGSVTCFPFDGDAVDSKGINTTVLEGGISFTTDRFNRPNKAVEFDGIDDRISLTTNQLNVRYYTISLWLLNSEVNLPQTRVAALAMGGLNRSVQVFRNNSSTSNEYYFIGSSELQGLQQGSLDGFYNMKSINTWTHIAFSHEPGSFRMFVNGEKVYNQEIPGYPETNLSSGNYFGFNPLSNTYFKGKIDDVKFFNSVLSDDEMKAIFYEESCDFEYQKNREVELVACYPLDGNANENGSILNGNAVNVTNAPNRLNVANTALNFNGTSSSISLPPAIIPNQLVEYSLSAWVKVNNYPTGVNKGTIFSMGGGVSEQTVYINSSGYVLFHSAGSNNVQPLTSISPIPLSTWTHITVIRSGNQDIMYINGQLAASQYHISSVDYSNNRSAIIGKSVNGNSFFSGIIDDVKLFDGAMYKDEVMALYQSTSCGFTKCPPILTYANPTNSPLTLMASKQISSTSKLNALPVEYTSSGSIVLNPGFEVSGGNYFKAHIDGCPKN